MSTTTFFTTIVTETCCYSACGVAFGLETNHRAQLLRSGDWFHCPNGHRQHFSETTEASLRRQLEDKSRRVTELACEVTRERDAKYVERSQKKRFSTMLHNHRVRARHGVCPCCKRTFKQLVAHMASKHPKYMREAA